MGYRVALLLCFCLAFATTLADVYRWTDKNGDVVFSDTPQQGAEKIDIGEPTIVPAQRLPSKTERTEPPGAALGQEYAGGEVMRADDGDQIQLYVDGAPHGPAQVSLQFVIAEIERGAHELVAAIVDSGGRERLRSQASVFFVHKRSIQHPTPANAGPG